MGFLTGLIGKGMTVDMRENNIAEVNTQGSLGKFNIDLKIVAIACAVFLAACLFSAPLSYIIFAAGAVGLSRAFKKFDGSVAGNNTAGGNTAAASASSTSANTPAADANNQAGAPKTKDPNSFISDFLENQAQKINTKVNSTWSSLFGSIGGKKDVKA